MRLALFEPDIPGNTGTMLRMAACLGTPVDVIEPCGFVLTDKRLRRAGMDYLDQARIERHRSWDAFVDARNQDGGRIILLTTRGTLPYFDFLFEASDVLVVGRETGGAAEAVHQAAHARIRIPMTAQARSLNVALTAAMVMGEALRQTGKFPEDQA